MTNLNNSARGSSRKLLLAAIIGASFCLRAPITSIGPLAGLIRDDLGVGSGFVGFITTLPLLAFAVCSPFVSVVSDRLGTGKTMLAGLASIVVGGFLRAYAGVVGLLVGTALMGVGIAIANVLIPSIIKLKFPERIGIVTSLYLTAMGVFASVGAGVSYPLAQAGLGWEFSSVVWAVIALLVIFTWYPQKSLQTSAPRQENRRGEGEKQSIWKSPLAWYIMLFFGLQSLNFYSVTAWIPSILQENGMTPETAGYMALWFQLAGMPSSFFVPILADRVKDQRIVVAYTCAAYFLGLVMLMAFHTTSAVFLALFFLSNGGAGSFSWALVMFSLKGKNAEETAQLSGMAQSVGYLLAATGPTLCGVIFDAAGTWSVVLGFFFCVTLGMITSGILAAKTEKLFH